MGLRQALCSDDIVRTSKEVLDGNLDVVKVNLCRVGGFDAHLLLWGTTGGGEEGGGGGGGGANGRWRVRTEKRGHIPS